MINNNALVVGYPNQIGDSGRYTLADQRTYFSKFQCGSNHIFELALQHVVCGDLLDFNDQCDMIFDSHYQLLIEENTTDLKKYQNDRREFFRRTFDIYRYAKTSLQYLGEELGFTKVKRLTYNSQFDSGTFLLR